MKRKGADVIAEKNSRGIILIEKINSIYNKSAGTIQGYTAAIKNAKISERKMKAAAENTEDIFKRSHYIEKATAKQNEAIALSEKLDGMLDNALPDAAEMLDDLIREHDEDMKRGAAELIKQLSIVKDLLTEQSDIAFEYKKAAELLKNELASSKIKSELQYNTRLSPMEIGLELRHYYRDIKAIENMIVGLSTI